MTSKRWVRFGAYMSSLVLLNYVAREYGWQAGLLALGASMCSYVKGLADND